MTIINGEECIFRQTVDQLGKFITPDTVVLFVQGNTPPAHFTAFVPFSVFDDGKGRARGRSGTPDEFIAVPSVVLGVFKAEPFDFAQSLDRRLDMVGSAGSSASPCSGQYFSRMVDQLVRGR